MRVLLNWLILMNREWIIHSMQGLLQCVMGESGVIHKRIVDFK